MDDPGEGMPMEDLSTAYWRQEQFRADPAVRLDERQMPMRLALMFTPLDEALPRSHLGGTNFSWTFFGGRPSQAPGEARAWPRRRTGVPLSHVLQVDLYAEWLDQGLNRLEATGLPTTGLLQFFHDLETYGNEEGDGDAWLVRWLPRGDEDGDRAWTSAPAPADLAAENQRPPVALVGEVVPTIPVFSDEALSTEERERYRRLHEWTSEHPYHQNAGRRPQDENPLTPWDEGFEPLPAPTRLGGFSAVPHNPDYEEHLVRHLPVQPGDQRFLLADIYSLQLGEDLWFHGGRHLEVWMRASDLAARRFDRVWALIRTDH